MVDVGIVVNAHFRNPAQKYAAEFLIKALTFEKRLIVPLSPYLEAYVVMTKA